MTYERHLVSHVIKNETRCVGKTNYINVLFYENISDRVDRDKDTTNVTNVSSIQVSRPVHRLDRGQREDGQSTGAGTTSVEDGVSLSTYTCL